MEQKHLQVRQCKGPDLSNVLQHQLFRFMFIDI